MFVDTAKVLVVARAVLTSPFLRSSGSQWSDRRRAANKTMSIQTHHVHSPLTRVPPVAVSVALTVAVPVLHVALAPAVPIPTRCSVSIPVSITLSFSLTLALLVFELVVDLHVDVHGEHRDSVAGDEDSGEQARNDELIFGVWRCRSWERRFN